MQADEWCRPPGLRPLVDPEHDAALDRSIDEYMSRYRKGLAAAVCDGQSVLDKIDTLALAIANTPAYDLNRQRTSQWCERLRELVGDVRGTYKALTTPSGDDLSNDGLKKALCSTYGLKLAGKLQDTLLDGLRAESKNAGRKVEEGVAAGYGRPGPAVRPRRVSGRRVGEPRSPLRPGGRSPANPGFGPQKSLDVQRCTTPTSPGLPRLGSSLASTVGRLSPAGPALLPAVPSPPVGASKGHAPRHTPHGDDGAPAMPPIVHSAVVGAAVDLTCTKLLSAAVYLTSEAIVQETKAEKGVVFRYIPARHELQAVACVGPGLPPASQIRIPPTSGLVGSVWSSRIAVNITTNQIARETIGFKCGTIASLLALPILSSAGTCSGAVLLLNKYKGYAPFPPSDETSVFALVPYLSYMLERYPVEISPFDPLPFHTVEPFKTADLPSNKDTSLAKVERRLAFRTNQQGRYLGRNVLNEEAEEVTAPPALQDVSSYCANLEECWDETVKALMKMEGTVNAYASQSTTLKDVVREKNKKIKMLKEIAREGAQQNLIMAAEIASLNEKIKSLQI